MVLSRGLQEWSLSPILSHSRVAIPIAVSELHYVHPHSHMIPVEKWETEIPIPFTTQPA